MSKRIQSYSSAKLVVTFDPSRCIHAAECVRNLGTVFQPAERPWIKLEGAETGEVIPVVERCPTGALRYVVPDGSSTEQPDAESSIRAMQNGPLYVRGAIELCLPDGAVLHESRVALCRCGESANKPFCDGSHRAKGFAAERASVQHVGAPLQFKVVADGPLIVEGKPPCALCRCGRSADKPRCDGSHRQSGSIQG